MSILMFRWFFPNNLFFLIYDFLIFLFINLLRFLFWWNVILFLLLFNLRCLLFILFKFNFALIRFFDITRVVMEWNMLFTGQFFLLCGFWFLDFVHFDIIIVTLLVLNWNDDFFFRRRDSIIIFIIFWLFNVAILLGWNWLLIRLLGVNAVFSDESVLWKVLETQFCN